MTGTGRRLLDKLRSLGSAMGGAIARNLRALMPPITLGTFLRALCGVLLFFCGIIAGIWIIIRYRRSSPT